jgi:hypothetical protein
MKNYASMVIFPLVFFAAAGAAIAAVVNHRKRSNVAWEAAARRLGITLRPTSGAWGAFGKLSMTGSARGLTVTIDTHQSNDTTFTRYRVGYPSLGLGFKAKRQHALSRLGTLLGFQDIEVGDPVFDEAIVLKGDYPERVVTFLTPARRLAISGLIEHYGGTTITDSTISYSKRGLATDTDELVSTMQRFLAVAQELRGTDRVVSQAAERRLAGDVGDASEILEQAPASGDPFIDFARKQQTGEIRYARGDTRGAREVFDDLKRQAPADPEIGAWTRPRISESPRRQPQPALAPAATDATTVAEHLFRKENYSFDTMEIFEAEYEGKTVSWSGDLKRLRRFDHDRDFGDGPGVKAVFAIAILGTDLYAGREVDAIVRLPHGAENDLEIGGKYSFRGRLSRCDPAMRNLFVTGATLV